MTSNDIGSSAREACTSIVKHYSDPIHYAAASPFVPSENSDVADDAAPRSNADHAKSYDNTAPYYDSDLGHPMPNLPPVLAFWYQRLLEAAYASTSKEYNNTAALVAARELLCCYESIIHPCVKRRKSSEVDADFHAAIEMLTNYELLVAHLRRDVDKTKDQTNVIDIISETNIDRKCDNNLDDDKFAGGEIANSTDEQSTASSLKNIASAIAHDICQWSIRLPKKDKAALWKVQNILLPCLLRLMDHSVVLLISQNHDTYNATSFGQIQEALAIATVAAVPFIGDGKLRSGAFGIGSLLEWALESADGVSHDSSAKPSCLSLAHTLQNCSLSPCPKREECAQSHEIPVPDISSDFMTRSVVDWSVPSAHFVAPWTDGVAGVGSRMAVALLQTIEQSSCALLSASTKEVVVENCSGNDKHSLLLMLRSISQNIGVDILTSAIRAHFFGRLTHSDAGAIVQPQTSRIFMPMIQRIGSKSKDRTAAEAVSSDERPHLDNPMRMSAAAVLLCAALPQPCGFEMWDKALSDALPIVMCLLDDVQSFNQAIGALILISVIEAASYFKQEAIPFFLEKFSTMVTSSLESSIQMCGREDPPALTTICLAQSKWTKYLELQSSNPDFTMTTAQVQSMARKAAADILILIEKQSQIGGRDGNDERVAGALVAGINPLLAQLANFPEAASVEIARIGLSTILPLLGWRGMSLEVRGAQLAALSGLISLMEGAYSIMPHHGKKIMTEVFLLMDRSMKDADFLSNDNTTNSKNDQDVKISTSATGRVALYAAAVCLAICDKGAGIVLKYVESTQSSKKRLINQCFEVRSMLKHIRGCGKC